MNCICIFDVLIAVLGDFATLCSVCIACCCSIVNITSYVNLEVYNVINVLWGYEIRSLTRDIYDY